MDKKSRIKIFCMAFALFVAVFTTGTAFAWFTMQIWNLEIVGTSAGAYFAYGDGTEDNPFGITHRIHMSNLAWLQNSGYFDDKNTDDKYYHFELAANIDMWDSTAGRNIVLPPIGNLAHPFKGFFDGHGYTISNLTISTNKEVLYGMPTNLDVQGHEYAFSNAVGLFGMTTEDSEIMNFILNQPTIEVSDGLNGARTKYTAVNEKTDPAVVGMAVGYVNGKVHSIGVKGGTLAVRRTDTEYNTFNSILGDLSENALKNNNVTGKVGGSGNDFGSDFDAAGIVARLQTIAQNNLGSDGKPLSFKLPNVSEKSKGTYGIAEHEKLPFTITSESTYTNTYDENGKLIYAREVVSPKNIGYILGDENAVHNDDIVFGPKLYTAADDPNNNSGDNNWFLGNEDGTSTGLTLDSQVANQTQYPIPKWLYHLETDYAEYYNTAAFTALSKDKMKELYETEPAMMKYVFGEEKDTTNTFESIQLGGLASTDRGNLQIYVGPDQSGAKGSGTWSPHGMIEWDYDKKNNDKTTVGTYGLAYEKNGYAADENGNFYQGHKGNNPDLGGRWSWIMDLDKTPTPNIIQGTSIPIHEFLGGVVMPNNGIWFRPANDGVIRMIFYTDVIGTRSGLQFFKLQRPNIDKNNPFAINLESALYGGDGDIKTLEHHKYAIPWNILFYLEIEVKPEDVEAGYEYWLCNALGGSKGNGAKFVYLDIGASGAVDDGEDTDRSDPTKLVTAIDFVYSGVTIAQEDKTVTLSDGTTAEVKKGTFVVGNSLYVETRVMLAFEKNGTGSITAFYYRKDDQTSAPLINAAYNSTAYKLIVSSGNSSNAQIDPTDKTVTITIDFLDTSPWRP